MCMHKKQKSNDINIFNLLRTKHANTHTMPEHTGAFADHTLQAGLTSLDSVCQGKQQN